MARASFHQVESFGSRSPQAKESLSRLFWSSSGCSRGAKCL